MDIKTYTSTLVLTLLMTSPAVMAMDAPDSDELGTPKTTLVRQDTPSTPSAPSRSLLSLMTLGYLGADPTEPSSSALPPSPASSSIDQDLQSATPLTKLVQVSLKKVAEDATVEENDGIITLTSDNRRMYTRQLETDSFDVTEGDRIQVTCDIAADADRAIGIDFLNSWKGNDWYCKAKQVLLEKGRYMKTFNVVVPKGEWRTSLVFYNWRQTNPTRVTIHSMKIEISPPPLPSAPPRTWTSLLTGGYFD